MKLKIFQSSSSGNCYVIEVDDENLMIECGMQFNQIKKVMDFDLSYLIGCLLTHSHL